ncbi:MAG: hypothetical protein CMM58_13325 [Rhodospirillaceae bacterium]|nr:hypothetical protein [Rhodospirillaceae bacterium]|tara:strand:+ start:2588 stop:3715 length:1128 start_codon:yes stop_codon:yes gene_type:complete
MLSIDSSFDGGNIEVIKATEAHDIQLKIRPDTESDFFQWFAFRIIGARDLACTARILNAGQASFPAGWDGYKMVVSHDMASWFRIPTTYKDGILEVTHTLKNDSEYFAYFAMYPMERHARLIAKCQSALGVRLIVPGFTAMKRPIEVLLFGEKVEEKPSFWVIARQHPGETMAEWFMEGLLKRLLDNQDGAVQRLLQRVNIFAVPNMNPDGSVLGNLRVNSTGINLNREWENPSEALSPEVFHIRNMMIDSHIKLCLDVHGDEALPYNFIAGFEGIAEASETQLRIMNTYRDNLERLNPDFQTLHGYPKVQRGKGMKTTATGYLSAYQGAVSMTLEMPFKDAQNAPNSLFGWSPERSMALGRSTVEALLSVIDDF